MTDDDWAVAVTVFRTICSRRGDKGRDDRKLLEVLHDVTLNNVSCRALPAEFGNWNSVWKRVLAAARGWCLRGVLRDTRRPEPDGSSGADVGFHRGSRPRFGSGRKRGQESQALGRSRGGFSTKIHLKTDFEGQPIAFHLKGGEAGDSPVFPLLLDIGPDVTPRAALADKGYDSKTNRAAARARGICPAIPTRSNAKNRPKFFPKTIHKGRARIEQASGKLKRFKPIAFRCEQTAKSFSSFVSLACGFILLESVHTA